MRSKKNRKPKSSRRNRDIEPKQNHTPEGPAEEYIREYDDDEKIVIAEEVISRTAYEQSHHRDIGTTDFNSYEG